MPFRAEVRLGHLAKGSAELSVLKGGSSYRVSNILTIKGMVLGL